MEEKVQNLLSEYFDYALEKKVNIKYKNQELDSNIVELDFSKNTIEIKENVYYMNNNTEIYADKVELDLLKKKMKISMINQNDNIQIIGKY